MTRRKSKKRKSRTRQRSKSRTRQRSKKPKIKNYKRLLSASDKGDIEKVRKLLQAGANVNLQDKYGETPLYKASEYGHTAIAKLLQ